MTEFLKLDGVTRRFGGLLALSDVSFTVPQGVVLGVIGPNGAGKTTLFNCIAGAIAPSSGRVIFEGKEIQGLHPHQICRAGIARTFQIVRPFRGMTVLENVKVAAYSCEPSSARAEALGREALDLVGLQALAEVDAEQIGIADMRRLEIARALATRPKLLLLDEMLAGLTATEAQQMCEQVKALRLRGITIIIVEHSVPVVRSVCDHAVVLNFGEYLVSGPVDAVLADARVQEAYLGSAIQ